MKYLTNETFFIIHRTSRQPIEYKYITEEDNEQFVIPLMEQLIAEMTFDNTKIRAYFVKHHIGKAKNLFAKYKQRLFERIEVYRQGTEYTIRKKSGVHPKSQIPAVFFSMCIMYGVTVDGDKFALDLKHHRTSRYVPNK